MKIVMLVLGAAFLLTGIVWVLQGLNIVKGSFMSGQALWGTIGVVAVLIGAGLLWFGSRWTARGRP